MIPDSDKLDPEMKTLFIKMGFISSVLDLDGGASIIQFCIDRVYQDCIKIVQDKDPDGA